MRIEIRLENGKPILFFPEEIERDKSIACYCETEGHASAARAYMRRLPKPESPADALACWRVLERYVKHVIYVQTL
jgi:hypothetical protein